MRLIPRTFVCLCLLAAGYALGAVHVGAPSPLRADPGTSAIDGPVRDKLRSAEQALAEAMQMLQDERHYVPAIAGLNAFATTVGGVDAVADLESGQGVDPETFAGLYAGQALPEVAEHLAHDAQGRVTYKSRVVRLYNPTRLKQLFAARAEFSPAGATAAAKRPAAATKRGASKEKAEESSDDKAGDKPADKEKDDK
jgi:hypothetical protein